MTFVVHHRELAAGPGLVDAPRCVERAADVEASVDQPAGDVGEAADVLDDLVGGEPGVVAPAVRHLWGDAEPETRVGVPRIGLASAD